jgi:hypothetical protein
VSIGIDSDAASGVHPGPDPGEEIATWSPYVQRPGEPFDVLYAQLEPEFARLIAEYEEKRSALIPLAQLFQEHQGYVSADAVAAIAYLVS